MFKVKDNIAPEIVNNLLYNETENHYDLRHYRGFRVPFVKSVNYGSKSTSYLGRKIWDIVPSDRGTIIPM